MNDFPKWVYFADGSSVHVDGPAELAAIAESWAESPAAFDVAEEPKQRKRGKA